MYLEIENNRSRKTVDASCPLLSDVCSDFHKINLFFFSFLMQRLLQMLYLVSLLVSMF